MMRKAGLLILLSIAVLSAPFLLQRMTLGFQLAKLHPHLPFNPNWETRPLSQDEEATVASILSQPFSYFNLGSQSYVFLSQDGKYVLKLFRYNRSQLPWIHKVKKLFHPKDKSDFFNKTDKTFQACKMAFDDVPDCTQLLYVHLNPKPSDLTVKISDPLGRKWTLPLGEYRFALQRRAEPFKDTLYHIYDTGNRAEMEKRLASFVDLLYNRTALCIRNSDHNYGPNFGFYEGKAIEIDCGNYRKRPELLSAEARIAEMHRFNVQLYVWTLKHAPEYSQYFYDCFAAAYDKIRNSEAQGR